MSGGDWYIHKDGVAMGSAEAVILSNIWLKHFEKFIGGGTDNMTAIEEVDRQEDSTPAPASSFIYGCCNAWFHRKCITLTAAEIKKYKPGVEWYCGCRITISQPRGELDKALLFGTLTTTCARSSCRSATHRRSCCFPI